MVRPGVVGEGRSSSSATATAVQFWLTSFSHHKSDQAARFGREGAADAEDDGWHSRWHPEDSPSLGVVWVLRIYSCGVFPQLNFAHLAPTHTLVPYRGRYLSPSSVLELSLSIMIYCRIAHEP
jgi:hypothetical protein